MPFDEELQKTKKQLAGQLTRYREASGLSVDELAKTVGMHRTTLYKIEAGNVASLDTLARLLDKCGLTLADFLYGFRAEEIPEDFQEDHRMLSVILDSGFESQIAAIRAALQSIYERVVRLKKAKNGDSPE